MASWNRGDALKIYAAPAGTFNPETQEFRFTLLESSAAGVKSLAGARAAAKRVAVRTPIDGLIESVEWRDEGGESGNTIPVLRGSVSYRLPHPLDADENDVEIDIGDRIKCDVSWITGWQEVWTMRVVDTSDTLDTGVVTCEMADDCLLLTKSRANWRFVKGRTSHRRGWRLDEIVRHVAKDFGFAATCFRGKAYITNLHDTCSPLEIIRQACERERKFTGQRYSIYWRNNRLYVTHPRRNPLLYQLADQITAGSIGRNSKGNLATVIRARGSGKSRKGKRRKYAATVYDAAAVAQFGYIEQPWNAPGTVDSRTDLVHDAKRELAKRTALAENFEITHVGIAYVRRNDAVLIYLPDEGLSGVRSLMWVKGVTHSLTQTAYTMSLTLKIEDPNNPLQIKRERDAARRAQKRAARKAKAS